MTSLRVTNIAIHCKTLHNPTLVGLRTSTRASVYEAILACTRVHFKYSVTREILYYRPRNETFVYNMLHFRGATEQSTLAERGKFHENSIPILRVDYSCVHKYLYNNLLKRLRFLGNNKTTAAVCISRRVPQGKKYYIEIFPLCIGHCCTILQVENSLETTLSVMLFEILTLFHFQQKSKMAAESGEK